MAHAARGEFALALEVVQPLRALSPASARVETFASFLLLASGRYRLARETALGAADLPADADNLLRLAGLLRRFEEPQALERLFLATDWRRLAFPADLVELAQILGFSGLYSQASACLAHVLELSPDYPDALYLKGLFEMFSGDATTSNATIQRALVVEPRMANAHWVLSMQDTAETAATHLAQMQRVMHLARPGSEASAAFDYSLHYTLHALGRHEEAWQALSRGHRTMRGLMAYDRAGQHVLAAALERMSWRLPDPTPLPPGRTGLIFIVGMFRSGTTLVERLLAGHPDVVDGGETLQFSACLRDATDCDGNDVLDARMLERAARLDFGAIRDRMQAYAAWRANGRQWLTEKQPANFLNIGFILQALPDARILHMRRDPVETCFSNLRTLFRAGAPYACDQRDLADFYLLYRRVMAHWHMTAPGRILDVDYDDFVADPEAQSRRIMKFCGLPYVPDALTRGRRAGMAATASAAHVRNGILKDRGRAWVPYTAHLQQLISMLRPAYMEP